MHALGERATTTCESAWFKVLQFPNGADAREVALLRGATEAINLAAQTYGRMHMHAGDEVIVTTMEHHANIVPRQMLCRQTGAVTRIVPITDTGELILNEYELLTSEPTRLVSVVHVSNALGTTNPVRCLREDRVQSIANSNEL